MYQVVFYYTVFCLLWRFPLSLHVFEIQSEPRTKKEILVIDTSVSFSPLSLRSWASWLCYSTSQYVHVPYVLLGCGGSSLPYFHRLQHAPLMELSTESKQSFSPPHPTTNNNQNSDSFFLTLFFFSLLVSFFIAASF